MFFRFFVKFWLGGAPPLKRSFVTFDRGGQTGPPRSNDFFFGAAGNTRAADDRPAGRPAERPAEVQRPAECPAEGPAEFLGFRVFGTVIGPLSHIHEFLTIILTVTVYVRLCYNTTNSSQPDIAQHTITHIKPELRRHFVKPI